MHFIVIVPDNYCPLSVSCIFSYLKPSLIAAYSMTIELISHHPLSSFTHLPVSTFQSAAHRSRPSRYMLIVASPKSDKLSSDNEFTVRNIVREWRPKHSSHQCICGCDNSTLFHSVLAQMVTGASHTLLMGAAKRFRDVLPAKTNEYLLLDSAGGLGYLRGLWLFIAPLLSEADRKKLCQELHLSELVDISESSCSITPARISSAVSWMKAHLHQVDSFDEVATKVCMSRRNFDRRFRAIYQESPKRWLIKQRVELAKQYLTSTEWNLSRIAEKSGFGSAHMLRKHFTHLCGTCPSEYRRSIKSLL